MVLKLAVILAMVQLALTEPDPRVNIDIKIRVNEDNGVGPSATDAPTEDLSDLNGCNTDAGPWWTPDYCRKYMLPWSATIGDTALAMSLLESGTDIDIVNTVNRTTLAIAAHWGRATLVDLLLKNGADPFIIDMWGTRALELAEARKCDDAEYYKTWNQSCTRAENNYNRTIALLKAGETAHISKDLYGCNATSGPWWTPEYCVQWLLHWTATLGDNKLAMSLIETGRDINLQHNVKRTALAIAAHWGRATYVDALLKNGADTRPRDQWGSTALELAENRKCENPEYFETWKLSCTRDESDYNKTIALLKAGEEEDVSTHLYGCDATSGPWWTPKYCVQWLLHWTATLGDGNLTLTLLETGRDINLQHNVKRTALHIASHWGRFNMVDLLLKNGADTTPIDIWGSTALQLAENRKCEIPEYFETWKQSCTRTERDYDKTIALLKAASPTGRSANEN